MIVCQFGMGKMPKMLRDTRQIIQIFTIETLQMLQPIDDPTPISIKPEYVPRDSYLYKLVTGSSMIPVTKTESGFIKTSSTKAQLELLKTYIETGNLDPSQMDDFFEISDYYGTYSLKNEFRQEFLQIKLKEDWFRKVFNVAREEKMDSNPIFGNTFRLIEVSQAHLDTYTLIPNLHYLYAYKVASPKTNIEISGLIKRNIDETPTLKSLHGPGSSTTLSKREIDSFLANSKAIVSHRYPRKLVTGSNKVKLIKQIQQTAKQFRKRDKLFEDDLIRECSRKSRQLSYIYGGYTDSSMTSKWKPTIEELKANIKTYPVCSIFDKKPEIWNNIVLAGGSVSNAIINCGLQVDYDLFIYGLTEEQASDKVVECIKLLSGHHKHVEIRRSKNAITYIANHQSGEYYYRPQKIEIQFILRLYASISEIIHGFDVDSSCVAYDGKTVYMTERANYAFKHMVNTVDLDHLSPSYEFLVKD